MSAHTDAGALSAVHHDGRVPAKEATDAALEIFVAGELRLLVGGDGVDVIRTDERRDADLALACTFEQFQHHVPGPVAPAVLNDGIE